MKVRVCFFGEVKQKRRENKQTEKNNINFDWLLWFFFCICLILSDIVFRESKDFTQIKRHDITQSIIHRSMKWTLNVLGLHFATARESMPITKESDLEINVTILSLVWHFHYLNTLNIKFMVTEEMSLKLILFFSPTKATANGTLKRQRQRTNQMEWSAWHCLFDSRF